MSKIKTRPAHEEALATYFTGEFNKDAIIQHLVTYDPKMFNELVSKTTEVDPTSEKGVTNTISRVLATITPNRSIPVECIKAIRSTTGLGLKESKALWDNYKDRFGY